MLNYEKHSATFSLPPLNSSKHRLEACCLAPAVIENNLSKNREHLEVSVCRFDQLTGQPKHEFNVPISSYGLHNRRMSGLNLTTTPMNFKWQTDKVPMLKLKKTEQSTNESEDERRKRLLHEQNKLLDEKCEEKSRRMCRSLEFQTHSKEVRKRFGKRSFETSVRPSFGQKIKFDVWGSDNFKDIALQKEIIKSYYETDSRRIRHYRNNGRTGFFEWQQNDCFDNLKKTLIDKSDNSL